MTLTPDDRSPPIRLGPRRQGGARTSRPAAHGHTDHIPLLGPTDGHLVDWSEALNAVPARLRQVVGLRLVTDSGLPVSDARAKIQIDVLACATALDTLNAALMRELRRCHHREHTALPALLAPPRAEPPDPSASERVARHPVPRECRSPMSLRRLFRLRLDRALAAAEQAGPTPALLTIDLEGFRPITEAHGPDVSNQVLQIIAARLSRAVRADDVVSRIGVQEFGCLLTGAIDRTRLGQMACHVFDSASAPLRVGTLWLHVTPSIGLAHGNACASGAAGMLLGANAAMLQARQQHSGYAFFEPPSRRANRRAGAAPQLPAPVSPHAAP